MGRKARYICIRSSLAMGIHRGTLAYICWGIQFECARGGGGGEKVVGIQLHTGIYIHVCACVCGRDMQILLESFSKSDCML